MGPNMLTIAGAALGAAIGFFRHQTPNPRFARAAEESGAIVLAVWTRSEEEANMLGRLITAQGARDLLVQ